MAKNNGPEPWEKGYAFDNRVNITIDEYDPKDQKPIRYKQQEEHDAMVSKKLRQLERSLRYVSWSTEEAILILGCFERVNLELPDAVPGTLPFLNKFHEIFKEAVRLYFRDGDHGPKETHVGMITDLLVHLFHDEAPTEEEKEDPEAKTDPNKPKLDPNKKTDPSSAKKTPCDDFWKVRYRTIMQALQLVKPAQFVPITNADCAAGEGTTGELMQRTGASTRADKSAALAVWDNLTRQDRAPPVDGPGAQNAPHHRSRRSNSKPRTPHAHPYRRRSSSVNRGGDNNKNRKSIQSLLDAQRRRGR